MPPPIMIHSGLYRLITFTRPYPRISPVSSIASLASVSPASKALDTILAVISSGSWVQAVSMVSSFASIFSFTVRKSPNADTYRPRQPELLQRQGRPSLYIFIWPISPILPVAPYRICPSIMTPAPNPVPKVRSTTFFFPLPAPKKHSPYRFTRTSLSINTGIPNRFLNQWTMGTFSHFGKFGENRDMPFSMSRRPGTPIPITSTSRSDVPAFKSRSLIFSSIRSKTPSAPRCTMVGVLCSATGEKSFVNREVLIFVPPRSIPIIYFLIYCPFRHSFDSFPLHPVTYPHGMFP